MKLDGACRVLAILFPQIEKQQPIFYMLMETDKNPLSYLFHVLFNFLLYLFQSCGIQRDQVIKLLNYIKRSSSFKFHALLRACALTNQDQIIRKLGYEPDDYGEAAAPSGIQRRRRQQSHTSGKRITLSF